VTACPPVARVLARDRAPACPPVTAPARAWNGRRTW